METSISLDHVSKKFVLQPERARSFLDHFLNAGRFLAGRQTIHAQRDFWAVRDVSFDVHSGELVSFVGANGSGKSTTLKLVAAILRPTSGSLTVNGHVAAMLELGTGFHADLTGRENAYLSGAILGLRRTKVNQVMDRIIEFADIGDFFDTPVRNYSSGMYVRLGFAVATHVGADILLVDEVLSVGDQAFQKKCIARIQRLKREGVTIAFVTHHMELARNISDRVLWFRDGQIAAEGSPDVVIRQYLAYQSSRATVSVEEPDGRELRRRPSTQAFLESAAVLDSNEQPATVFRTGDTLTIRLAYCAHERVPHPVFGLAIFRDDGLRVNGPNTGLAELDIEAIEGQGHVDYKILALPLLSGRFYVTAGLFDQTGSVTYDYGDNLATFEVHPTPDSEMHGVVHVAAQWHHHPRKATIIRANSASA